MILPLADSTYLEIVEVLDHPASDKAPFGQAVRARSALGGGWLGWVVAVDDITDGRATPRPRGRRRQPPPPRRHQPHVEADRRQRPDLRPAAAVLRRVEVARLGPPERRRHRGVLPGLPGDRRRPAAGQRVARAVRRGAAGGREGRVGRPARHARHHRGAVPDAERAGPARDRLPGVETAPSRSPNIWHHTATYELENRAADPEHHIESAMRGLATWSGRTFLDLGCGTGFHLPRWAEDAAAVIGVEPHADLVALAAAAYPPARPRHRAAGHRPGDPAPRRVRGRGAGPMGVLLRPRLRARAGRARPGGTPRGHRVRRRQRRRPGPPSAAGSAAATR